MEQSHDDSLVFASPAPDLGPHFRKIKEGIYVQSAREVPEYAGWSYQERMPTNVEAAYRVVNGR